MVYLSDADLEQRRKRGEREQQITVWGGAFIASVCLGLIIYL